MSKLNIATQIANELSVQPYQIEASINLLNEGATIPFIARYRKEVTGSLDDEQLRKFEERYLYLTDLESRKETILKQIESQDKLTPKLKKKIESCLVKSDLEDLYLPFKPKRLTKAVKAREAGLEPLALKLWTSDFDVDIFDISKPYCKDNYPTEKEVLEGCLHIMIEKFSEDADLLAKLKSYLKANSFIQSKVVEGKEEEGNKFKDYFDYKEELSKVKSHRFLAIQRGRGTNPQNRYLNVSLNANPLELIPHPCEEIITKHALELNNIDLDKASDLNAWRKKVISWTWRTKLSGTLETELLAGVKEIAEEEAINVFASNLKSLLLASPAKAQVVIGLDPGIRTGVKTAVVDSTGKVLETTVLEIFDKVAQKNKEKLYKLITDYNASLIAIGNGTGSRETARFVSELLKEKKLEGVISPVIISEAGASVYSASELSAMELADLDVSLRGAVSIARRLQDPLAELVKIDPKSIGVGQYQHDVNQSSLTRKLDNVVEDCVNKVGVDLNTASVSILSRISGVNKNVAANIVNYRNEHGRFANRKELMKVPKLGAKAFEQCAGFLRITDGASPLDNSSVHPESYKVVEQMAKDLNVKVGDLIGSQELLSNINASKYVNDKVGLPTIMDILEELKKPGRDPRGEFKQISFKEGVEDIKDLEVGMILNGAVTNVTNFGCFVDIGVHQDGLVHIKNMSENYIKDPNDFVKPGEEVQVQVLSVDIARNRIELTMIFEGQTKKNAIKDKKDKKTIKKDSKSSTKGKVAKTKITDKNNKKFDSKKEPNKTFKQKPVQKKNSFMNTAFAEAFAKAKNKK